MIEQLKIDFNKIEENSKFSEDNIKFRKKNLQHFVEKGFPNKRIEDWKFSDLNQIISSNISNLSFFNDKEFKDSEQIYLIDKFEHNKIIFINGVISKIDIKHEDGKKIIINNDLDFIGNSNEINPLVSLNNALANTYTCVTVKATVDINVGSAFTGVISLAAGITSSTSADGTASGDLEGYTVNRNGEVLATFTNGEQSSVGKVAIYHFQNDQGLTRINGSKFEESSNSGKPVFYKNEAGENVIGTTLTNYSLEGANIDMTYGITELIILQRSFDANSKSITTADQMMQKALNMDA